MEILPIIDSIMMLELSGQRLLDALENGVSQYPRHEGRFPQVSGMSFTFDPTQPSGQRVITESVRVGKEPLELDRMYKLCTKGYIGQHGKDGYGLFKHCKRLVPEEEGPILFTVVRAHFESCSRLCSNGAEGVDSAGIL